MSSVERFSLVVVTVLHLSHALECASKPKLSSCSPGRNITLFDQHETFSWILLPTNESDENIFQAKSYLQSDVAKCRWITECKGSNGNLERVDSIIEHSAKFVDVDGCLSHYCESTGKSKFCIISYDKSLMNAGESLSALSINTVQNIQHLHIFCAIEMTEQKMEKIMNFKCMWKPKYYGIQSVITISDVESTVNYTCTDLTEDGSHVMKISPWTLFEKKLEVSCALREPYQQSCNYSLYITPWVSNISLGESINLTCPTNGGQLKWQEMSPNGVSVLNVSQQNVIYHPSKVDENGVLIMCSVESGTRELVLGIGKVIVSNSSMTPATTFLPTYSTEDNAITSIADNKTDCDSNFTEMDTNTTTLEPMSDVPPAVNNTSVIMLTHIYIIVTVSFGVLTAIGICLLFKKCKNKLGKNLHTITSHGSVTLNVEQTSSNTLVQSNTQPIIDGSCNRTDIALNVVSENENEIYVNYELFEEQNESERGSCDSQHVKQCNTTGNSNQYKSEDNTMEELETIRPTDSHVNESAKERHDRSKVKLHPSGMKNKQMSYKPVDATKTDGNYRNNSLGEPLFPENPKSKSISHTFDFDFKDDTALYMNERVECEDDTCTYATVNKEVKPSRVTHIPCRAQIESTDWLNLSEEENSDENDLYARPHEKSKCKAQYDEETIDNDYDSAGIHVDVLSSLGYDSEMDSIYAQPFQVRASRNDYVNSNNSHAMALDNIAASSSSLNARNMEDDVAYENFPSKDKNDKGSVDQNDECDHSVNISNTGQSTDVSRDADGIQDIADFHLPLTSSAEYGAIPSSDSSDSGSAYEKPDLPMAVATDFPLEPVSDSINTMNASTISFERDTEGEIGVEEEHPQYSSPSIMSHSAIYGIEIDDAGYIYDKLKRPPIEESCSVKKLSDEASNEMYGTLLADGNERSAVISDSNVSHPSKHISTPPPVHVADLSQHVFYRPCTYDKLKRPVLQKALFKRPVTEPFTEVSDTFTLDSRTEQNNQQYPTSVPEQSNLTTCLTMPISDVSESGYYEFQHPLNEGASIMMECSKPVNQTDNIPANNSTENSQNVSENVGSIYENMDVMKLSVEDMFDASDYELLDPNQLVTE